jgi:hypothetical protein
MNPLAWVGLAAAGAGLAAGSAGTVALRRKGLHRWLWPYLTSIGRRRAPKPGEPVHVLLAICDHYEPKLGGAPMGQARDRVRRWVEEYPRLFADFRDSDGRPPRHSFFYPAEEYEPEFLDGLAGLCRQGFGEVEVHLHHDNDTAENLRRTLTNFKRILADRHGLLSRDKVTGEVAYGFIHGNWALDNARCDGRWCGVNNELDLLRETGCYADFTLPSAPSETQTRTINRIYYAVDDPAGPKSHNTGVPVGVGRKPDRGLMLIQGPLCLDWGRRKLGVLPGIENANLQATQAPSDRRLEMWLRCRVQVPTRPDWFFVKLHTHGANEANMPALLGEPMVRFHQLLRERANGEPNFRFHYVTAREMYNLAVAAEAGHGGDVSVARDWRLVPEAALVPARSVT